MATWSPDIHWKKPGLLVDCSFKQHIALLLSHMNIKILPHFQIYSAISYSIKFFWLVTELMMEIEKKFICFYAFSLTHPD